MQKYANLVELEKFCQTHIFLQNFVLIQPRTSPPKICKILSILLTLTPNPYPYQHADRPVRLVVHRPSRISPCCPRLRGARCRLEFKRPKICFCLKDFWRAEKFEIGRRGRQLRIRASSAASPPASSARRLIRGNSWGSVLWLLRSEVNNSE